MKPSRRRLTTMLRLATWVEPVPEGSRAAPVTRRRSRPVEATMLASGEAGSHWVAGSTGNISIVYFAFVPAPTLVHFGVAPGCVTAGTVSHDVQYVGLPLSWAR